MKFFIIILMSCFEIITSRHEGHARKLVETNVNIQEEIYYDSLEYLAMCVEAEAGNQSYLGKVYVADCIINRFEQGDYDNYYEVIDEPGQFCCVSNGSINCIPSEETMLIVYNELSCRTNDEILYFRTGYYHSFATDCFQYEDHYFSK